LPLSLVAALTTLFLFAAKDKKFAPRFGAILFMIAIFLVWVTFTASLSDFPTRAWAKWDWASKVLIFAVLIPYIFRSRVQIEAFILVFVFAASTIFFSAGVKTIFGGGGYGVLAIMGSGNTGLAESSTLALVCVMLIPLMVFVMRHSLLLPKHRLVTYLFVGMIVTALAAVVGTSARTGVIAVVVLCLLSILKSKKKLWWFAGIGLAAIVVMNIDLSSTHWGARMSTIETYNADSSALGRLKVWQWTINFVGSHPLGGGFDAYMYNRIAAVSSDGIVQYLPEWQIGGKAFHSIYFEILGEQGIVGFTLYFSIILLALLTLRKIKKTWRNHAGMAWVVALSDALTASILVFLAGGAFVGIAYQPYIFYMVSLTVALDQYALRAARGQLKQPGQVTT
jgi:probable O-glycosylation ligase (exosortase A-associated)